MIDHDASGPDAALPRLIEALTAQADASRRALERVEAALPLLERIAVALERPPTSTAPEGTGPARSSDITTLRERIDAARLANDPDGALASHEELARLLSGEPLKEVDGELVKWLMSLIHRRLRTGSIRPDVVELAARVADRFGGTAEGASLRAALPTLRRSAGLCPRCAEPYTGLADACPKCLMAAPPAAGADPVPEDDPEAELQGRPVDWNNDELWQAP